MRKSIISGAVLALLAAGCGAKEKGSAENESKEVAKTAEEEGSARGKAEGRDMTVDLSGAVALGISGAEGSSKLMLASGEGPSEGIVAGVKKILDNGEIKGIFGPEWTVPVRKIVSTPDRMLIQVGFPDFATMDTGKTRTTEMYETPIINTFECQIIEIKKADNAVSCAIEGVVTGEKGNSYSASIGEIFGVLETGEIVGIGGTEGLHINGSENVFPEITETRLNDAVRPVIAGSYVLVSGEDSKGQWVKSVGADKKPVKLASLKADWMISVDGIGYFQTTSPQDINVDGVNATYDDQGAVLTPGVDAYSYKEVRIMKFQDGVTTEESFRKVKSDGTVFSLTSDESKGVGAYKMGTRVVVLSQDGDALKLEQTLPEVKLLAATTQKALVKAAAYGETLVMAGEQLVQYDPQTETEKVLLDGYDIWDFAIVGDTAYLSTSQGPNFMTIMVDLKTGAKTEAAAVEQLTQLQAF
jgi:hypothetical protein